jgi:aminoacylase
LNNSKLFQVIPSQLNAYFDIRIPPTVDLDAFEKQIAEWCKKAGPDVKYEFLQVRIDSLLLLQLYF